MDVNLIFSLYILIKVESNRSTWLPV